MDQAQLQRVRALFDALVDLPTGDRDAALDREAADDPAVRVEVRALLHIADSHDFLTEDLRTTSLDYDDAGMVGQHLGAYKLERVLGTGGMGTVFEATRDDAQYLKRVAIKLVMRGGASDLLMARFRLERQILARLEHRNIATLLDGGLTPDGRPYLVMEYVDGAPITAWCDAKKLGIRDRLQLFRQVCAAVQYAHANLIIHRDLKPANVFVTSDGTVKLLDFGIAKLLGGAEDEANAITRAGGRALTPEYASPEQLRGEVLTTASDLYSLGVVLFEVLAGARPHRSTASVFADDAPLLSTQITDAAGITRDGDADRVRRMVRGDVEQIVAKLLRKEPDRRYASAEAVSDDLQRYLSGLTVRAQADSVSYRLGKFVRRNRAAVVAAAAVVVSLIGGVIVTSRSAKRATLAQDRAERVSGFLQTVLSTVPSSTSGRDLPISEVIDSAALRLPTELAAEPEVRAELEGVIANAYQSLGKLDAAETHMRTALRLRELTAGVASRSAILALDQVGNIQMAAGELDSAAAAFKDAIARADRIKAPDDTLRAQLLTSLGSLANARGVPADALKFHQQALAIRKRVLAPTNDEIGISMGNVAVAYGELNRWADAEAMHRESIRFFEATAKGPNVRIAEATNSLATALDLQGKTAAADSAYRKVLAMRAQLFGTKHPDYAFTAMNYGMFVFDQGRYDEAATYARATLALRNTSIPESHPAIAASLQTLGRSLDHTGDHAGAERALRESLELRTKFLPKGSWLIGSSEGVLGEHFLLLRNFGEAERYMLHADSLLVAGLGDSSPRTQSNIKRLVRLYEAWQRPADADRERARLTK
jgi:eukaryotic-like serine/threonine-protein kinase